MAGLNPPMNRQAGAVGGAHVSRPRLLMSWEDWLTFAAAIVAFLSIAISIQNANWVRDMPAIVPTAMGGLLIGMLGARLRAKAVFIHPVALFLGAALVLFVVQTYADGPTIADRVADFRFRMREWFDIVRAGDISNDNLPFVTFVHSVTFLCAYLASWSIYRWRNPWIAIIPGGMVLLANISFMKGQPSGAFIVFTFGAIVLVARLYLQRNQLRWERQHVEYPDLISVNAIQLTLVATLALIIGAWMLPLGNEAGPFVAVVNKIIQPAKSHTDTLVRLFHNVDSQKGVELHSFGDVLAVQGHVKLGTNTVLEINSPNPGLVRAQSYDEYTGNGWRTANRVETRIDAKDLAITDDSQFLKRNVSVLKVKVLDSESTILTPGTPIGSNLPTTIETPRGVPSDIEIMRSRKSLGQNDSYNSLGSESSATADELRAAGAAYPQWVTDRYLQLPKSLPQRVRDEAKRVATAQKAATPYDVSTAIETYLRTFPFDTDVESAPPGRDTVDFFLFDLKRGYFDYQASAMTVMLRSLGVPARVAVGYVLDPANAKDTVYSVQRKDAYAWVEVFFPDYGWVNFNPTQDRQAGGAGGIGALGGGIDSLQNPDLSNLFPIPDDGALSGASVPKAALAENPTVHSDPPWVLIFSLLGALAVVALGGLGGRFAWNRATAGMEPRVALWAKTQRLATWGRIGPNSAETPREWSRRMGGAVGLEDDAKSLAEAYEESRYGRPDLRRIEDSTAVSSYKSLRGRLLSRIFRRYGQKQ
jgi:transglutaminase-like putative cysteine protease